MANVIRLEFDGTEDWLDRLPKKRRERLQSEIAKAQVDDCLVDALLFTQLPDKATIIRKSPRFKFDIDTFENEFEKIRSLGNHVAHASDYAASPEAAVETSSTVRLIDKWTDQLAQLMQIPQA